MKNKEMSRSFYWRVAANIGYSTLIACMVEIFLITNLSLISRYIRESGKSSILLFSDSRGEMIRVLLYVLLGIAVFSVSFLLLQHKFIAYMADISRAMQNISKGDLNTAVDVIGDDELSQMAASLNKMAEDIRELMDKEREAERTKNELITNIAHDLRTPLTSIIGYLELLSGNGKVTAVPAPEVQKKYIDIAYTKAKRLEKLIEDLFGFTKMTYGKVSMKVSQVDIIKLLSQLLEEFYPSFADKNLTYELTSNVPAQIISADGSLLARLFDNLINNAIKYGADGKRILVNVHGEEEFVTVSITNYGYVIPETELSLIFNKFYRVEQSRSSSTGGTGLGLAIAKNVVDMHGGSIQVASDLNGTVFTVRLKVHFDVNKENFGKIG